ncbi:hypothetical protein LINPERHAP2_LOCUS3817, partial [Linum perenne]
MENNEVHHWQLINRYCLHHWAENDLQLSKNRELKQEHVK